MPAPSRPRPRQTRRPPTRPTAPPARPPRPSASWVARVARPGTPAGQPTGCPGPAAKLCPALPTKAAGWRPMHLARTPRGPGHGGGWTRSQIGSPHASPRRGGLGARPHPRSSGPGVPCTRPPQGPSQISECDGAAQLLPRPHPKSSSFNGLNPPSASGSPRRP